MYKQHLTCSRNYPPSACTNNAINNRASTCKLRLSLNCLCFLDHVFGPLNLVLVCFLSISLGFSNRSRAALIFHISGDRTGVLIILFHWTMRSVSAKISTGQHRRYPHTRSSVITLIIPVRRVIQSGDSFEVLLTLSRAV